MLGTITPVPTLAVSDLARARGFYEGVLGLLIASEGDQGINYTTGSTQVLVYPSSFAGTNKATAVSFPLDKDAFDTEVAALRTKGVTFQTFDLPEGTWTDGVASYGDDFRSVWFSDPDGNIINLETGM
ncbi:VOC family protein [Raineyella sp. W15-4]|uniref:VOC family protein n=1 Tax=Raineyella sp. W15-4 TaxID=3081651 RepID=UPI0029541FD8|nr:VOC family protein [Raineyella sp. W15-4]WOQ18703.1 VOC family protein [Raineyella sp. W15-4]